MVPLVATVLLFAHFLSCTKATDQQVPLNLPIGLAEAQQGWIYFNEVTGAIQREDPGNTPYEDEAGNRYWLSLNGERVNEDPERYKWTWVEIWSPDSRRHFYYNQQTRESVWDRPPDLAWRRLRLEPDEYR
ncbi:hypothetical protein Agub_g15691 [Astrephomene gubernaculifera]|uniref:WW domain-containing protein n=1 Tax=Astrephomene gubernaculifera TaxID=47775 RepID=A0AAD3HT97_9CHLO|nr:hypothetical protein Agub_g15691 [Astrephomene gubernaculifera]